jgi:hypothetical protein
MRSQTKELVEVPGFCPGLADSALRSGDARTRQTAAPTEHPRDGAEGQDRLSGMSRPNTGDTAPGSCLGLDFGEGLTAWRDQITFSPRSPPSKATDLVLKSGLAF